MCLRQLWKKRFFVFWNNCHPLECFQISYLFGFPEQNIRNWKHLLYFDCPLHPHKRLFWWDNIKKKKPHFMKESLHILSHSPLTGKITKKQQLKSRDLDGPSWLVFNHLSSKTLENNLNELIRETSTNPALKIDFSLKTLTSLLLNYAWKLVISLARILNSTWQGSNQ